MLTAITHSEPQTVGAKPTESPLLEIREAVSYSDVLAAARLVTSEYFKKGFIDREDEAMVRKMAASMEGCRTFLIFRDHEPVTTLSYTMARPLPMETDYLFEREIQGLRAQDLRIAELTKLAGSQNDKSVTFPLITYVCAVAATEVDVMAMTVHHRHHHAFYTRLCGFTHLTKEVKPHPSVKGTLAYGLYGHRANVLDSVIFKGYFNPSLVAAPVRAA